MRPHRSLKPSPALDRLTPPLRQAVVNLHHWQQRRRWLLLGVMWLVGVPLSLVGLRYPLALLGDYFTWSAVRYGLAFHPIPAAVLIGTLLFTGTSLLARWFYRSYGLGGPEVRRLEKQVRRIQQRGQSHPLWPRVWGN